MLSPFALPGSGLMGSDLLDMRHGVKNAGYARINSEDSHFQRPPDRGFWNLKEAVWRDGEGNTQTA